MDFEPARFRLASLKLAFEHASAGEALANGGEWLSGLASTDGLRPRSAPAPWRRRGAGFTEGLAGPATTLGNESYSVGGKIK